jgi:hypothetical protein
VKVGLDSLGTRMLAGFPLMVPGAGTSESRTPSNDKGREAFYNIAYLNST